MFRRWCTRRLCTEVPNRKFNILFLGQDGFSSVVFQQLYNASDVWKDIIVATNADTKTGRNGKFLWTSPLKTTAQFSGVTTLHVPPKSLGMKTWQVPDPFRNTVLHPDNILITASFGRIIPSNILDLFAATNRFNVHPSLLPQYRGPSPIQQAIVDDCAETGVSILSLERYKYGIDAGDIWISSKMPIASNSTFTSLWPTLAAEGGKLLVSTLRGLAAGTVYPTPQQKEGITHAPLIYRRDAMIQWNQWDAHRVDRVYRGIGHQFPLVTRLPSTESEVELKEFTIHSPPATLHPRLNQPGQAIYDRQTRSVIIRCANDTEISVTRLQRACRKEVPAIDFWNGVRPTADGLIRFWSLTPTEVED